MAVRSNIRVSKAPKTAKTAPEKPQVAQVEADGAAEDEFEAVPMPTEIRIGPFVHQVKPMDLIKSVSLNRIGEYDTLNLSIEILEQMPAQRKAETLLHELFHGLWHVTGLRNDEDGGEREEHSVTMLSMAMAQVIRDNPLFVAYMLQNLGDN